MSDYAKTSGYQGPNTQKPNTDIYQELTFAGQQQAPRDPTAGDRLVGRQAALAEQARLLASLVDNIRAALIPPSPSQEGGNASVGPVSNNPSMFEAIDRDQSRAEDALDHAIRTARAILSEMPSVPGRITSMQNRVGG